MKRRISCILLFVFFLVAPLGAEVSDSWFQTSVLYDYPINSATIPSSGSGAFGAYVSNFFFPFGARIGLESKFGGSFSFESNPAFARLFMFCGPVFSTALAGGVLGYLSVGPAYTFSGTGVDSSSQSEQQVGVGLDAGARFRISGGDWRDFAFVAGAYGELSFLHVLDDERIFNLSGNIRPYVGFSFGYDSHSRYPGLPYTVYDPVYVF